IGVIAHIPYFQRGVFRNFALKAKAPAVDLVRSEVVGDGGLHVAARIKREPLQLWRQLRPDVRPERVSRPNHTGRDLRPGKAGQEDNRRGVGYVQIDVVERRVIEQAIAAAEDGLAVAGEEPAPLWRVGEAQAWPKAGLRGIQFGEDACRQRNVMTPERGGGVVLALRG